MAQITFHGSLRASAANAFLNGPADKVAIGVNDTVLYYNSSNPIAVGDILYTDQGFQNVFNGGGTIEFFYTSDDENDSAPIYTNKVVEIEGIGDANNPLGTVKSVTLGPTYSIEFQDANGNQITNVDEGTQFKVVVTETGSPAMTSVMTAGGQAGASDFDSWPFTTNQVYGELLTLDFTQGSNVVETDLTPTADNTSDGNKNFTVQLTNGQLASITINDTSQDPANYTIEWDDTSALTVVTGGSTSQRSFTMGDATQQLNPQNDVGFSNNNNWNTATSDVQVTQSNGSATGGTLNITVPAYTGFDDRSVDITLIHPDANPAVTSSAITLTQTGTGLTAWDWPSANVIAGNSLQISFTDLGGQQVSDVQDGMPFIDIATLPQNGNLYDVTANQVVLSQGATLDANSGNPGVFYTPNAGFGAGGSATDSFTYTARDSDGNTLTKTITITVGPPANTAPSISSFSVSCNGFGSTGTSQQFNVIAVTNANPQDEDVPSLTYQWASDSNGSNPVSFPGVPTLPDIDLVNSGVGDTIFTMSKPAGTNLGVNDSSITNSAWLRATDNQGDVSSWVEVQFTLASEQNAPPVVTQGTQPSTGAFAINQYNQDSVNLGLTVSDPDGNTINLALDSGFGFQDGSGNTLSNAGNVSINGMVVTYEANITGMTQGQVQTVKFQITVADQYGAIPTSNHPIVFTYDVTPVAIINIDRSNVFASSNSIACASTASTNAYLNATQASDITQLQAGDSIYQTANTGAGTVSNPVASSSTSAQWIKIRQTVSGVLQERAVEIDSSGIILSIV